MTKLKYGGNNLYKIKVVLEIEGVNNDTCMNNVSELVRRPFVKRVNCIELISETKNENREY